jgi:hypothetical protein
MKRYYFHVHNSVDDALDREGLLYPDLEAAKAQAIISIRSILAEELKNEGLIDLRGRIEIVDEEGLVISVPYGEAVRIYAAE